MIIGIANNLYPPYGRDSGAEIISKKMADDLTSKGHQVFIISTRPKNETRQNKDNEYYLPSNYESLNKMLIYQKLIWHLRQILFPPHQKEINKILITRKPDLFITHNLLGLSLALPQLLAKLKIKHHHVLHDIQLLHPSGLMYFGKEKIIHSFLARIYQYFSKRSVGKSTKIISPSKWLLDLHLKQGFFKNQITELKRNFDLKKSPSKELSGPVKFFFAGQLEGHKGISLLIKSWQASKLSQNQAILSVAGRGSLINLVKEASKKTENIYYLGHLDRLQMQSNLGVHDVVIITSLIYENSPTIIWEAAKKGLRVIAPEIGGIPELQEFTEMSLYKAGDVNALAEKIRSVVFSK